MKLNGMKIVAIAVSTFMISFMRRMALTISPVRPDRPADFDDVPFGAMKSRHHVGVVSRQDGGLDLLDFVADPLEHRKIGIDHGIDQGVGKEPGGVRAEPTARFGDADAYGIEAVPGPLLKADKERVAHKQGDLLRVRKPGGQRYPRKEEMMRVVFFRLRALLRVEHVFHRQVVQRKPFGQAPEECDVRKADDIDPHERMAIPQSGDIVDHRGCDAFEGIRTVVGRLDRRLGGIWRTAQDPRRRAGLAVSG